MGKMICGLLMSGLWLGVWCAAQTARETQARPATQRTARLAQWESLGYGMFIHFGLSTFIGDECPGGDTDPAAFNPTHLDVDQWIKVARDSGMKYAVLTAKHCSGHCLWPSQFTDHDVESGPVKTDVVREFVTACHKYDVKPGFYYLLGWDSHHQPKMTPPQYEDFCKGQLTELLSDYGPIQQLFLDIPFDTGPDMKGFLARIYLHIKSIQPDCLVLPNQAFTDGSRVTAERPTWLHKDHGAEPVAIWPRDLMDGERTLPPPSGHNPNIAFEGRTYYLPMEVCDTLGESWFWTTGDTLRPARGLYSLYKTCRDRGANLLLDVGPDQAGRIPEPSVKRLMELKTLIDRAAPLPVNLCAGATATASNIYHGDNNWSPAMAIDGNFTTRWATDDEMHSAWLEVDFGKPITFSAAYLREGWDRTRSFDIEIPAGDATSSSAAPDKGGTAAPNAGGNAPTSQTNSAGKWQSIYHGTRIGGDGINVTFNPVTARRARLSIREATIGPTIWDFELYETPNRQ